MLGAPQSRVLAIQPPAGYAAQMIEWSETHLAIRDAFRRFVETEIKPKLTELEHGDMPPYDVLRKMVATFGLADMARMRFAADLAREPREPGAAPRERKWST